MARPQKTAIAITIRCSNDHSHVGATSHTHTTDCHHKPSTAAGTYLFSSADEVGRYSAIPDEGEVAIGQLGTRPPVCSPALCHYESRPACSGWTTVIPCLATRCQRDRLVSKLMHSLMALHLGTTTRRCGRLLVLRFTGWIVVRGPGRPQPTAEV